MNKFIEKKNHRQFIIKFLTEGAIELGLTALVSMSFLSREDFQSPAEFFSTSLAMLTLLALAIAPGYTVLKAKEYKTNYFNAKIRGRFSQIFEDKNRRNIYALNYNTFFFIRRYAVMIVIITVVGTHLAWI